jgi:hypothetical protein
MRQEGIVRQAPSVALNGNVAEAGKPANTEFFKEQLPQIVDDAPTIRADTDEKAWTEGKGNSIVGHKSELG